MWARSETDRLWYAWVPSIKQFETHAREAQPDVRTSVGI